MVKNDKAGMPDEEADPEFNVNPEDLQALLAGAGANPALIAAMQQGLMAMVGSSSGYIESLPAPIRARVAHLEDLQTKHDDLEEQFEEEVKALEAKYRALYAPIIEKRRQVIAGEVEAPENETEEGKKAIAEAGTDLPAGIPEFWATALSTHPMVAEHITDKDREVLAFITDIKSEDILDEDGDEEGFKVIFEFAENPFFTDKQLIVSYYIAEDDGYMSVKDIEGCEIHWKPEKDITVKKMRKKPKPGAKNKAPQTKLEPVESFFRWFTDAPEVPENLDDDEEEDDEEMEDLRDRVEAHVSMGEILRSEITPNAVKWFTGEAAMEEYEEDDDEEEGSDDEGDEDEDEEGEDSDDDEDGDGPKDSKEQPAECKQQ